MGNIVLLDDLTINKIAAGEVIERPASAVKEMLENSIDAGATNIILEIKNGGISYIRITDNGKGIANDDLDMAFERHATSKIRTADDLTKVKSMGFRGEALASISAISKVEMISKTVDEPNGYKIVVEGGKILEKTETGAPVGTTIIVKDLFFNTPVRYKFLRKDFTEAGYIEDAVSRVALSHPEVAIKLINSGRTVIQTNGSGDLKNVIYSIYGKDIANSIIDVNYTLDDIHIFGVIGKPEIARSNRANQIFFINKRYVKDKTLTSAVEKAYKDLIPFGKFAFAVLNIEMNPSKVDVNVHPAKLEVRFEDENTIFKAVYHAIKENITKEEVNTFEKEENNFLNENKEKNNTNKNNSFDINKETDNTNKNNSFDINKEIDNTNKNSSFDIFNKNKPKENKTNNNEALLQSQEVLKKLQEIKEKILQESSDFKVDNNFINYEENNAYIKNIGEESREENNNIKNTEEESREENNNIKNIEEESREENNNIKNIGEESKEENNAIKNIEEESKEENNAIKNIEEESKEENNNIKNTEEQKIEPKGGIIEDIFNSRFNNNLNNFNVKEVPKEEVKKEENILELDNNKNQENQIKLEEESTNYQNTSYTPEFEDMYMKMFGTKPIKEEIKNDEEQKSQDNMENLEDIVSNPENISIFDNNTEIQKIDYKFIGIVFDKYAIFEIKNEIYFLDIYLAQERILYESIKNNIKENNENSINSQLLLIPDVITLSRKEMEIVKDNSDIFKKIGFIYDDFGENTIKLTEVPEICADLETQELFLEILSKINSVARTQKEEIEQKIIQIIAENVIKKYDVLKEQEEIKTLMDRLLSLKNPFITESGISIAMKITKYDIERKFARK